MSITTNHDAVVCVIRTLLPMLNTLLMHAAWLLDFNTAATAISSAAAARPYAFVRTAIATIHAA